MSKAFSDSQLNKSMLMGCLREEGFSQSKAQQMWDSVARSNSWTITKIPSADDEPALIFQVFKSDHPLTPVITAPFETVYKQLAKLWKVDFTDTQPNKPAPKAPRYTRQQEKTAAAKEVHLLTEGLNEVQMKQMRDMIADSLKPIAEKQQQQKYAVAAVQSAQNATATKIETHADALGQIGPALQQMAACWSLQQQQQQRFFLPGLQYASAGPAFVPTPSEYAEAHSQCGPALAPLQHAAAPSQHAPAFGTMS